MNFLLRTTHHVTAEPPPIPESPPESQNSDKSPSNLEGLIAEDPFPEYSAGKDHNGEADNVGGDNGGVSGPDGKDAVAMVEEHVDVSEEEGWITIPYKNLPENWNETQNVQSLRALDRSFVFPGEQLHVLACLSACKQEVEIITPFKVAAVMCKNGIGKVTKKQNGNKEAGTGPSSTDEEESSISATTEKNGENCGSERGSPQEEISVSESFLRMEDHKRRTESLLQRFKDSHFFVRIAESDEPLWSKKGAHSLSVGSSGTEGQQSMDNKTNNTTKKTSHLSAIVDRGNFDANVSGGLARDSVKCCSLSNGDIMVLLQVNVGVDSLRDPVMEILQFEKYQDRNLSFGNQDGLSSVDEDPYGELLKWLLPLENNFSLPPRSLSPPPLGSTSSISSTSHRSAFSASSGSQLFSFGHFRSYSMSSLPQNTATPPGPVKAQSSKPSFDIEEWDHYSSQKTLKSQKTHLEGLLSFRGISLERERFSIRCGLEGIHIPGRRWRRKLEIIQPIEIQSYATDCNTDDLLCVQIKNVAPAHIPDILVYIDAITVVFEEASKGGTPTSLPIACIESGNDHSLPNLALRRGEEHSFILKPASFLCKDLKTVGERASKSSTIRLPSKIFERKGNASSDQYAIMVSCRCNYTESRLFFKKQTSWRPRISRDLLISVSSEISGHSPGSNENATQLPVQVLTLQASNLTSEDLTMTVLAPAAFTSPPSVVSLNSPETPVTPFVGFSEFAGRSTGEKCSTAVQRPSSKPVPSENQKQNGHSWVRDQTHQMSDVIPTAGLGCTHLWLQSRVPLGCVPTQSTATIKLELLPLTDGIITLDTLQINIKEKGLTYIPEHSLMINATTSITTGII